MQEKEFAKIWNLLAGLWPANIARIDRRIWQNGLAPYGMDDCARAIMDYARRNKLFPDLADVTAQLLPEAADDESIELYGMTDLERMQRMIDKLKAL